MANSVPAPEEEQKEKKNNKVIIIVIIIILLTIGAIITGALLNRPKNVSVTISSHSFNETFDFSTDKKNLYSLMNSKGLLNVKEENGEEIIIGVRGINIDPDDSEHWEVYENGELVSGPISNVKLNNKDTFLFKAVYE